VEQFGFDADAYRAPSADFIDGVAYDGTRPNASIDSLTIGLKACPMPLTRISIWC
jgi:nitrate/nitrite transport system substrate-binding protein